MKALYEAELKGLPVGTTFCRPRGRAQHIVVDPAGVAKMLTSSSSDFAVNPEGGIQPTADLSHFGNRVLIAMGDDTLTTEDILRRLYEREWEPVSDDPLSYLSFFLNGQGSVERVNRGVYKVREIAKLPGTSQIRQVFSPSTVDAWKQCFLAPEEVLEKLWTVKLRKGTLHAPKPRGSVLVLGHPRKTLWETLMEDD